MKDLTYKFESKRVIRVINKFTLDYVEIRPPLFHGQEECSVELIKCLLGSALGFSLVTGNSNPLIDGDEKPKFHYYCSYTEGDNEGICYIMSPLFRYILRVDLETNKFTKKTIDALSKKGYTESYLYSNIGFFENGRDEDLSYNFFKQDEKDITGITVVE